MSLHPSIAAVRRAVRTDFADLAPGARIVVACSGGADSLALLSAVVFTGRSAGWHVIGATVDHGLQAGSAEHADQVVVQMAGLGVDETVRARASVDAPGLGPEAAARRARYAVLEQLAESFGADAVALGHTRDDQAETVLLGLARGSGARSLAGMRRRYDVFRRPLLDVSRDDTVTACQVEGIEVWEDPHNADPAYTRVRVRTRVLPVLEHELGPGIAQALARTADLLRADTEALDRQAVAAYEALAADGAPALEASGLDRLDEAVATRVLRLCAVSAGATDGELFAVHVRALADLAAGRLRGEVQLPGRITAYLDGGTLRFRPT